jgi:large subunit ribosomal protein L22
MDMENTARLRFMRVSPQKAKLVANLVRGKMVDEALEILRNTNKAAASPIRKLIRSAEANLISEKGSADVHEAGLFIAGIRIDEGPTMKRIRPRAMGRAFTICKRSSHVTVTIKNKFTVQKETS